ncbi:MAG: magnesium transporter CorA family protein [Pseudomonadota bacterium]
MLKKLQIEGGRAVPSTADPAPIWVYVNPDESERKQLVETLKIDEHTLASALDPDEVSRMETEPEHVAVVFKRPKTYRAEDNLTFKTLSTGLFLFKERVIVVMTDDVPLFNGKSIPPRATSADLMLRILSSTIAHFIGHLRSIVMISEEVEQKIHRSMENKFLFNLFTLEKSLVYYLNALNGNAVVIDKLRNNSTRLGFTQEQQEFLEDLAIENQQCYRQAEIYSNILSSLMDARASIVGNNLNRLMKTLTIITLGVMLPTLVVSIFSMNVGIPLQSYPHAFWIIMGLAAVSSAAVVMVWRWKRW